MNRPSAHSGFTLFELVLVLVIIALAVSVAAPKLRSWSHGQELRESADRFVAMTRYARAQAAAEGTIYRLTVDTNSGSYTLTRQDGNKFVAAAGDFGEAERVPDGYHIELMPPQQQQTATIGNASNQTSGGPSTPSAPGNAIDFYPSGRTQVSAVRIVGPTGDQIVVNCTAAAEDFAVAGAGVNP